MNFFLKSSITLSIIFSLNACGGSETTTKPKGNNNSSNNNNTPIINTTLPAAVQSAIESEKSILSQELTNTLAFMGNEERLAYDVYNELYRQYGSNSFKEIATRSEYQHITAVQALVQKYRLDDNISFTNVDMPSLNYINTPIEEMSAGKYDISEIQALYDTLVAQGSASDIDALKVGCIIEVVDINDLNRDITLAQSENANDIVTVFNFLRDGSYNHYWAFDRSLKSKGVTEGCCSLGTIDGVNYCHPEYPQNTPL